MQLNSQPPVNSESSVDGIVIVEHASALVNMTPANAYDKIESAISHCYQLDNKNTSHRSDSTITNINSMAILVGQHSNILLQQKDKELVWSFPTLFPYGRGGPNEKRYHSYSYHSLMQHYLKLSDHKFKTR